MSKKQKVFQGREVFSRMNFLYQASSLMVETSRPLACHYGNLCRSIGKKSVLRMEPKIKRTLCKSCGIVLKPAITGDMEIIESQGKDQAAKITCKICGSVKNFVLSEKYGFWLDKSASIVERIPQESEVSRT